jgi:hypothetical protein
MYTKISCSSHLRHIYSIAPIRPHLQQRQLPTRMSLPGTSPPPSTPANSSTSTSQVQFRTIHRRKGSEMRREGKGVKKGNVAGFFVRQRRETSFLVTFKVYYMHQPSLENRICGSTILQACVVCESVSISICSPPIFPGVSCNTVRERERKRMQSRSSCGRWLNNPSIKSTKTQLIWPIQHFT